jgi:hypothetical protein
MAGTIMREAVAAFDDPEALKAAVSELQGNGFDRADISFLARDGLMTGHVEAQYRDATAVEDDPAAPREAVVDETDIRQRRTLEVSMAATAAAFAAAGFTVMSGGTALVAAGAAAAAIGGVGGLGELIGKRWGSAQRTFLSEQLERGGILVWVRTRDGAAEMRACDILRRHAGHDVHVHEVPAGA